MKYTIAIVALIAATLALNVNAQNQLKDLRVTNITPELSVYPCGDRHEAMVILRCQLNPQLSRICHIGLLYSD